MLLQQPELGTTHPISILDPWGCLVPGLLPLGSHCRPGLGLVVSPAPLVPRSSPTAHLLDDIPALTGLKAQQVLPRPTFQPRGLPPAFPTGTCKFSWVLGGAVCPQGIPFISPSLSWPGLFYPSASDVTSSKVFPGPQGGPSSDAPSPRAPPTQLVPSHFPHSVLGALAAEGPRWPRVGGAASRGRTRCLPALGSRFQCHPWELVGMRILGPHPKSAESVLGRGHRGLL